MKKRGFTDRLYTLNLVLTWLFTLVCIAITLLSGRLYITDFSVISVGLGVVWGELSIHTGFVIWKAKCENMQKYGKEDNISMF